MTTSFLFPRFDDGSRLVKKDHLKLNFKGNRLLNIWQCSTLSLTVEREDKSHSFMAFRSSLQLEFNPPQTVLWFPIVWGYLSRSASSERTRLMTKSQKMIQRWMNASSSCTRLIAVPWGYRPSRLRQTPTADVADEGFQIVHTCFFCCCQIHFCDWRFVRQKQLNGFPPNSDGGWVSAQTRPH